MGSHFQPHHKQPERSKHTHAFESLSKLQDNYQNCTAQPRITGITVILWEVQMPGRTSTPNPPPPHYHWLRLLLGLGRDLEGVLHCWDAIVDISDLDDVHLGVIRVLKEARSRGDRGSVKKGRHCWLSGLVRDTTLKVRKTLRLAGLSSWFRENALTLTVCTRPHTHARTQAHGECSSIRNVAMIG